MRIAGPSTPSSDLNPQRAFRTGIGGCPRSEVRSEEPQGAGSKTGGAPIQDTLTLHVPFRIVKRGGRKEVTLPEGAPTQHRPVDALVKALVRAFRWKRMLDSGEFAHVVDLARHEDIAVSYLTRVLRLTLLAPDIVEAILDGRQGTEVTLAQVLEPFPEEWVAQRASLL